MAWVVLFFAGLLETAWAYGLKASTERFSIGLLVSTVALMIASLAALYWSMRTLPLGIAYPIWTGLGSAGALIVSATLLKQQISIAGIAGMAFLIAGMLLLGLENH